MASTRAQPKATDEPQPTLLREHQVQVLNGSAGCALAEIVENG
jgi:hypothetical protein